MRTPILRLALGLVAAAMASAASAATTYVLTAPNYSSVTNYTTCAPGLTCGNFTTSQHPTMSFTVVTPLPPNLSSFDISGMITAYAGDTGLDAISSTDPQARLSTATVTTDATGAITQSGTLIAFDRWVTAGTSHTTGDYLARVVAFSSGVTGVQNAACTSMYPADACHLSAASATTSSGSAIGATSWSLAAPAIVPTLSEWAMIGLTLLLGGFGAVAMRRDKARAA